MRPPGFERHPTSPKPHPLISSRSWLAVLRQTYPRKGRQCQFLDGHYETPNDRPLKCIFLRTLIRMLLDKDPKAFTGATSYDDL